MNQQKSLKRLQVKAHRPENQMAIQNKNHEMTHTVLEVADTVVQIWMSQKPHRRSDHELNKMTPKNRGRVMDPELGVAGKSN